MSGRRRKSAADRQQIPQDLTLSSYADSSTPRHRIRKSDSVNSDVNLVSKEVEEDWFERGEDDILADVEKMKGCRISEREEAEACFTAQVFPYDFWFLLSGYIEPQFIGTFARISKLTNHIVGTQVFWRRLYQRYYKIDSGAGSQYSPESMTRLLGYRTRVIKLLHLTHPPFREKLAEKSSCWPDPGILVGRVCTLHWTSKISRQKCFFYFKLKDTRLKQHKYKHTELIPDEEEEEENAWRVDRRLLDDLSDINHNTEQGCKLLQVCNVGWCQLQPTLGLKLKSVSLSVSNEMKHHKLCLDFGSGASKTSDIRVTLNSVLNIQVVNWWNPHYKAGPSS